ncbi:helix-turn-helix domain-containing protein [Metabacillus halosaccharovorans]|uniref:helix-turn-helix domain-containing protein n=1 Tax=Metabacillus halosaccharovorans TaxID=930124 RepID=UPI00403DA31E
MEVPFLFLVDPINKEEISSKDFSEFVFNMRHSIGLTRREFALAMGVNRGTVVFWERGNIIPSDFESILKTIRIVVKLRIRNKRLVA